MQCNMSEKESHYRVYLAVVILLAAMACECWWPLPIALILIHSASKKYCPMYALFRINKQLSKESFNLSALATYSDEPRFVLSKEGIVSTQNSASKKYLHNLETFDTFIAENSIDLKAMIEQQTSASYRYEESGTIYNFLFKGVKDIEGVLVYCMDVTELIQVNEEIKETQRELLYTLGSIAETRSQETGRHVKRVAEYSYILAIKYGLSEKEAKVLQMASPMHDIGKIGIEDAILCKPGKLTEDEFEIMKQHTTIGYHMLGNSERELFKAAAIVANEHHEKYDGTGYPRGIRGDAIHIYGRITAICDVFDALCARRVYKKAWSLEEILDYFRRERGRHFDPKLVDLFFENLDEILHIRQCYADNEPSDATCTLNVSGD